MADLLRASRSRPRQPPSGHVFRAERRRGVAWYAKYRLPDGRQVQKKIGPAWSGRGRPPAGYFTKRLAEDWLRDVLDQARRGTLVGMVRTGATFADAAAEFMHHAEHERQRKPSTLRGYRSILNAHLLPAFGDRPVEQITSAEIEQWRAGLSRIDGASTGSQRNDTEASSKGLTARRPLSSNSKNHIMMLLHAVFARACKVYKLPVNPVAEVERYATRTSGDIEVFSPEEVWALVRAADSEQDGALFLTAAFTGLRMGELVALRWRDVDFVGSVVRVRASWSVGSLTAPKSGKVRSVPLAPQVAQELAKLSSRELFTGDDDLVFVGETGSYLDDSALRRRYKRALERAGLRQLRFHDLRHTFGTRMIAKADIRRVQEWMGHADIQTTMRYLHFAPREEDAQLVAEAFAVSGSQVSACTIERPTR
jgi:integrase